MNKNKLKLICLTLFTLGNIGQQHTMHAKNNAAQPGTEEKMWKTTRILSLAGISTATVALLSTCLSPKKLGYPVIPGCSILGDIMPKNLPTKPGGVANTNWTGVLASNVLQTLWNNGTTVSAAGALAFGLCYSPKLRKLLRYTFSSKFAQLLGWLGCGATVYTVGKKVCNLASGASSAYKGVKSALTTVSAALGLKNLFKNTDKPTKETNSTTANQSDDKKPANQTTCTGKPVENPNKKQCEQRDTTKISELPNSSNLAIKDREGHVVRNISDKEVQQLCNADSAQQNQVLRQLLNIIKHNGQIVIEMKNKKLTLTTGNQNNIIACNGTLPAIGGNQSHSSKFKPVELPPNNTTRKTTIDSSKPKHTKPVTQTHTQHTKTPSNGNTHLPKAPRGNVSTSTKSNKIHNEKHRIQRTKRLPAHTDTNNKTTTSAIEGHGSMPNTSRTNNEQDSKTPYGDTKTHNENEEDTAEQSNHDAKNRTGATQNSTKTYQRSFFNNDDDGNVEDPADSFKAPPQPSNRGIFTQALNYFGIGLSLGGKRGAITSSNTQQIESTYSANRFLEDRQT